MVLLRHVSMVEALFRNGGRVESRVRRGNGVRLAVDRRGDPPGDEMEGRQLLDLIRSKPEWQKEFEKLSAKTLESDGLSGQMKIIVTKNGDTIGSIPAKPSPFAQTIRNVTPGYYEVRLNTGRVLWQADLKEEDLLWSAAFPEEALDLAADTGESVRRITKEFTILGGEITIRVYPEIESGRIEVEVRDSQFEK